MGVGVMGGGGLGVTGGGGGGGGECVAGGGGGGGAPKTPIAKRGIAPISGIGKRMLRTLLKRILQSAGLL